MRRIILHNSTVGHDKVYILELLQEAPSGHTPTYCVTATWGRRRLGFGYTLPVGSQTSVKVDHASLPCALECIRSCKNAKLDRGYTLISETDGAAMPQPVRPLAPRLRATRTVRPVIDAAPVRQMAGTDECGSHPLDLPVIDAADYWKR